MEQFKEQLEKRKHFLTKLKIAKEKALKNVPEGLLRINQTENKTYYYLRTDPKDFQGKYIRKKDTDLARKLAQKDYDEKILRSIEKEIKAIEKYIINCPNIYAEQIYKNLHAERQKLIRPIAEPIEEYIRNWENKEYQGKGFEENIPEIYTSKGERVRSKSEVIIADLLNKEQIPYRYECPIQLKGWGIVYPDFTALNVRKEIYWEHFGMMDDPEYAEKAIDKITRYAENGIIQGCNIILTFETKRNPISSKQIKQMIQQFLE